MFFQKRLRVGQLLMQTILVSVLVGCGFFSSSETAAEIEHDSRSISEFYQLEKIPAGAPEYNIGMETGGYAPFEIRNEIGQTIGFGPDLIYAIATAKGFKVNILNHPWKGLLETLNSGERDIVAATVTATPERMTSYDFTQPYFVMEDLILVRSANPHQDVTTLFADHSMKYSTLSESSQYNLLIEAGVPKQNIIERPSLFLAVKDVFVGNSDAVLGDGAVIEYTKQSYVEYPSRIMQLPYPQKEHIAFVVKKGNTQLQGLLDDGLKEIYFNGTYAKIYKKWFKRDLDPDFLTFNE